MSDILDGYLSDGPACAPPYAISPFDFNYLQSTLLLDGHVTGRLERAQQQSDRGEPLSAAPLQAHLSLQRSLFHVVQP